MSWQNAMSGSLPEEGLRAGRWLEVKVSENQHTGSIPCFILRDNTRSLRVFEISVNHFTGMLCEGIRHMTTVQSFKVAYNQLAGSLSGGWRRLMTPPTP
eukprot:5088573-Amphidinium_carterae.1